MGRPPRPLPRPLARPAVPAWQPGHRQPHHRRWAHAGLWRRLLEEATTPRADPALRGLAHWICCAYRRAIRVMGLRAVLHARALRQHSALNGLAHWLPRPDLLGPWRRLCDGFLKAALAGRTWRPPPGIDGIAALALLRDRILGRTPLPRWAEPA